MINLEESQLVIVKNILKQHLAGIEVWAFGSRVDGHCKPFSDLDLVIIHQKPIDLECMVFLKEAFSDSNLPIKVDLIEWYNIPDSFREIIEKKYEVIQGAN